MPRNMPSLNIFSACQNFCGEQGTNFDVTRDADVSFPEEDLEYFFYYFFRNFIQIVSILSYFVNIFESFLHNFVEKYKQADGVPKRRSCRE